MAKMKTVKCPKCGSDIEINIAHAVDENGEVFHCKKCGYYIRYTDKVVGSGL